MEERVSTAEDVSHAQNEIIAWGGKTEGAHRF